jgi:hypothetical protein
MSQTIIPPGYRISVTTWENDADNYRTETIEGVPEKHVPFIVAVCKLLRSKNGRNDTKCFGNMYEPSEHEMEAYHEALQKVIDQHPDRPKYCDDPEGVEECLLYELGFGSSEYYATRVFESIKIEHIPEKITLQDVTSKFT